MTLHGGEPDVVESLVELGLLFADGYLEVSSAMQDANNLMDKLIVAWLQVMRFEKYSGSRWLTVGGSCRTLTAAVLLGIGSLVECTRADPKSRDY